jgi:gamma-glutamyl hydrolase
MKLLIAVLLLVLMIASDSADDMNLRPIIGIVSEETHNHPGHSYIAASYVKFIESAGGQVVPILSNSTEDEICRLFGCING